MRTLHRDQKIFFYDQVDKLQNAILSPVNDCEIDDKLTGLLNPLIAVCKDNLGLKIKLTSTNKYPYVVAKEDKPELYFEDTQVGGEYFYWEGSIEINRERQEHYQTHILLHELGHYFIGGEESSREDEFQAEALACLSSAHFGCDQSLLSGSYIRRDLAYYSKEDILSKAVASQEVVDTIVSEGGAVVCDSAAKIIGKGAINKKQLKKCSMFVKKSLFDEYRELISLIDLAISRKEEYYGK